MKTILNYKQSDLIFFDIETARIQDKLTPGTPLHDAWQHKARHNNEMAEKMSREGATVEVTADEFYEKKASLYSPFSRVVCICAGRIDETDQLKIKTYSGTDEKRLLEDFNNDLSRMTVARPDAVLAGFMSVGFDTPTLLKRMIVNGIVPHGLIDQGGAKPWEVKALDLGVIWRGNSFYPDSLASVAASLGLPSPKVVMDGSEVSEYYYHKKDGLQKIQEYCRLDTLTTANIYRRFAQKTLVKIAE